MQNKPVAAAFFCSCFYFIKKIGTKNVNRKLVLTRKLFNTL